MKPGVPKWGLILLALGLCLAGPLQAASLKAGASRVEITPPIGLPMYGFANRKGPSDGIRDPLYARVLVLEAGEQRMALVVLDLGTVFPPAWIKQLRATARQRDGIGYVLVAATHTHSGPSPRAEASSPGTPDWTTPVLEKVSQAIDDAHQHAVAARLGVGYGVAYIGHNRLRVEPNGSVTWFERNLTKVPTAPVDPTVTVLRVDSAEGKPLAILVNYACHPVVFGSDNREYSADYPGVMIRTVEQAFGNPGGGQPTVFFLQGGDGDINPYYAVTPLEQDAVKMRDWTGETLGRVAARVAEGVRTKDVPDASLDFAEDVLDFHLRWNVAKLRAVLLKSWGPQAVAALDRREREGLHLPVAAVLINKRIALATMPGEPFVDYQIEWRQRCPVADCLFMGYSNGDFGYFPTLRMATLGGYGAANVATYVEVGAGARMLDHALIKIYEFLGRLSDTPEK
jgi:neutral ceramidase